MCRSLAVFFVRIPAPGSATVLSHTRGAQKQGPDYPGALRSWSRVRAGRDETKGGQGFFGRAELHGTEIA